MSLAGARTSALAAAVVRVARANRACHAPAMAVHTREQLESLNRLARRGFSHAFMSDTKWRKLFAILENPSLELVQMRVQFIDVEAPEPMKLPTIGTDHVPRPYLDTIEFGPVELRSIEWLEIPAVARLWRPHNVPAKEVSQDLGRLEACLARSGSFLVERSGEALRILGYRR